MPLSPIQSSALRTLDWLLSEDEENRRTGRTYVLAVAWIRQAMRHPHRTLRVNDHFNNGVRPYYALLASLVALARNLEDRLYVDHDRGTIEWTGRRIMDWTPGDPVQESTLERLTASANALRDAFELIAPKVPLAQPTTLWDHLQED